MHSIQLPRSFRLAPQAIVDENPGVDFTRSLCRDRDQDSGRVTVEEILIDNSLGANLKLRGN